MNDRHRVFVSYYHDEDQADRDLFESLFSDIHDIMVSESVEIGDIDDTNLSSDRIFQIIREDYLSRFYGDSCSHRCPYMATKIRGLGNRCQHTPYKIQPAFRTFGDIVTKVPQAAR